MRQIVRVFTLILIVGFTGLAARAEYPLAYVGPHDIDDYSMSPDGMKIALLKRVAEHTFTGTDNWDEITIKSTTGDGDLLVHAPSYRLYFSVTWGFDDLILAEGIQYDLRNRARDSSAQAVIYAINAKTGAEQLVYSTSKVDIRDDVTVPRIVGASRDTNEIAMVVERSRGKDLIIANIETGEQFVADKGSKKTQYWEFDDDFRPFLRFDEGKRENVQRVYYRDENGRWKLQRIFDPLENDFMPASNLSNDQKMLVVHRPDDAETSALYLYDFLNDKYIEQIFQKEGHDIVTLRRETYSDDLLYVGWFEDQLEKEWISEEFGEVGRMLDGAFKPEDNWSILETSVDGRKWLLYVSSPTRPGSLFHFDVDTLKARHVINLRPDLKKEHVFPIQRVDYTAQDGLPLFGYYIEGRIGPDAPLIVHPHGGPVARDHADFDGMAQYLAYLGYNVFQPQFRGSGELGRGFEEAGFGEWGRAMQTDIDDGVAALEAEGLINPDSARLIVGASYGGYAAMAGAALTPDKYTCVISINGVSDLAEFIDQFSGDDDADRVARDVWVKRIGNPETAPEAVRAISPRAYVSNIKANILLIHGDADDIVHVNQSRETFRLLQEYGVPSMYHELEGAGHSVRNEDQRAEMLMVMQRFLYGCQSPWN